MAIVKSEYNVLNPTSGEYDTHYLKTNIEQVVGLQDKIDDLDGKADNTYTKTEVDSIASGKVSKSGDTMSGALIFSGTSSNIIKRDTNTKRLDIYGGTTEVNGGTIELFGEGHSQDTYKGAVRFLASDGDTYKELLLKPNGTLVWNNNDLAGSAIVSSGTNYIRYASGLQICWGASGFDIVFNSTWGSLYVCSTRPSFSFPVAFSSKPRVMVQKSSSSAGASCIMVDADTSTTNISNILLARPTQTTTVSGCELTYIAIGKWK